MLKKAFTQTQEIQVNIPDKATKQLKIQDNGVRRRVTLSSNWLVLFGFLGEETPVVEKSLGKGKGIRVRLANAEDVNSVRVKKVYTRYYNSRSANPLNPAARRKERQIQISSQELINDALGDCTHVHIVFRHGEILFLPIEKSQATLLQSLKGQEKINTLVAMTGGVDCNLLEKSGFRIDTVVEYRPNEKRDKTDYTEMTALSSLINSAPRVLVNEDIYQLNPARLAKLVGNTPITVGHFSLQCDDYSTLKTHKQRETSVEDLSSTLDMFIPMLDILRYHLKIPVVVIENVPGFMSSPINDVVRLQLKRMGYQVNQGVFDARDYGGYTSRKRLYLVASTLNSHFEFPTPNEYRLNVWEEVIEPNWASISLREVTGKKVVTEAIKSGRARLITQDKPYAPTLTKAQGQDTKDSVIVEKDGRYYRLPVSVQQTLNCIDDDFDVSWAPVDKASQIIGQSICGNLHHAIMDKVKSHIHQAADNIELAIA